MFHTFASAEFKKGPRQPSYEEQYNTILKKYENNKSDKTRQEILQDYFSNDEMFTFFNLTDTQVWNKLWKDLWKSESAMAPMERNKFLKFYAWLYPELSEIKDLNKDLNFKDALKGYLALYQPKQTTEVTKKQKKKKKLSAAEEEKQRIEKAEEERLEKKTMELKKQTRDQDRDNAIKDGKFDKYKFNEPLYVGDVVKVSGYVGRIYEKGYPGARWIYKVKTFHDWGGKITVSNRKELFRPKPLEPGPIKYKDDKGQLYTYDEDGLLQGNFCIKDEDDNEDDLPHDCGDYWHGALFQEDSRDNEREEDSRDNEREKDSRDNEWEKAIKNKEFETYKLKEPLYVKDIVNVYGYVGRIKFISKYPKSDTSEELLFDEDTFDDYPSIPRQLSKMTVYLVYTFYNMQYNWYERADLFRLIRESNNHADIWYRDDDDVDDNKAYDFEGLYHGYSDEIHGRFGEWFHGEFYKD